MIVYFSGLFYKEFHGIHSNIKAGFIVPAQVYLIQIVSASSRKRSVDVYSDPLNLQNTYYIIEIVFVNHRFGEIPNKC